LFELEILRLEIAIVLLMCFSFYRVYRFTFSWGPSSSRDIPGFLVGCVLLAVIFCSFLAAVRGCLWLRLDIVSRSAIFSVGGVAFGLAICGWMLFGLQEDERKHHIRVCDGLGAREEVGHTTADATSESLTTTLSNFMAWIISGQWWHDVHAHQDAPVVVGSTAQCAVAAAPDADTIVVQNCSLKMIKVCFYASRDLMCWIPFGGVSGEFIAYVPAEQYRSFRMPRQGAAQSSACWKLKVFQPALFDKELACYSKAYCGQVFAFFDVEGMVRRSRLLSAVSTPRSKLSSLSEVGQLPDCSSTSESSAGEDCLDETVSDEARSAVMRLSNISSSSLDVGSSIKRTPSMSGIDTCGLRQRADSDFSQQCTSTAQDDTHPPSPQGARIRATSEGCVETKRAPFDTIVIRNRSSQEVKAQLFRSTDLCCILPVASEVVAPHSESRFTPPLGALAPSARSNTSPQCASNASTPVFTLKVYSVGAGARELTYWTASCGHTYMFCDSLLT
jgi:hypothetical protein